MLSIFGAYMESIFYMKQDTVTAFCISMRRDEADINNVMNGREFVSANLIDELATHYKLSAETISGLYKAMAISNEKLHNGKED